MIGIKVRVVTRGVEMKELWPETTCEGWQRENTGGRAWMTAASDHHPSEQRGGGQLYPSPHQT